MGSFKIRKCVSLGGLGSVAVAGAPVSVADLTYGANAGDLIRTRTPWVRLFAQWDFFAPFKTSLTNPNDAQFRAMQLDLDKNIASAKRVRGHKVILTTRGFPGTSNTSPRGAWIPDEGLQSHQYSYLQAPYLHVPTSPTPQPLDGPYWQWVTYLMDRYHPNNISGNPVVRGQRASIDYFEVINEPNYEIGPGPVAPQRTALMFKTAYTAVLSVNGKYRGQPIRLLGPATSDSTRTNPAHPDYRGFTRDLLNELKALSFPLNSGIFGWSHHNYKAVENIARAIAPMPASLVNELVNVSRQRHQRHPDKLTPIDKLYGPSTQNVRNILRSYGWRGWGTSGQHPQLFLTEGGVRLNAITYPLRVLSKNQLQAAAVGIAAELLATHRGGTATRPEPGQGVEMFTNFLFYSESGNDSGLRNPAPDFHGNGNRRLVYETWTQFRYLTLR